LRVTGATAKSFATELTICAADRPGLFADIAGALAATGIEILSADVNTREDGIALDTFILRQAALIEQSIATGGPQSSAPCAGQSTMNTM
jgi:UTP:GlnB (protein PII) uridylyltransferase